MESSLRIYVRSLLESTDNEFNALSTINIMYDVINSEESTIDLNLEILFDATQGLIPYLKTLSKKRDIQSELIEKIFDLLECLIRDFTINFKKYIQDLVNFCNNSILQPVCKDLKNMSYDILKLLMNSYSGYFQQNCDWLKSFFKNLLYSEIEKKSSSTEKRNAYLLLGEIIALFPELIDTKKQNQIFRLLLSSIRKQLKYDRENSCNFKMTEIQGLYECLQLFLKIFHEESYVKENKELYGFVKEGCAMVKRRKASTRAAFRILENHLELFVGHVFSEYIWWHEIIVMYLRSANEDDQKMALHVLNVFYPGIARILKKKEMVSKNDQNILEFFIGIMKDGLRKNKGYEVAVAMENFGYFAGVCKAYHKTTELQDMFLLVVQLAENYCSGQIDEYMEIHHFSGLIFSMSKIAKNLINSGFCDNNFSTLSHFSSFIIISYPKVAKHFQFLVIKNLIRTVKTVACTNDTFLNTYLTSLMLMSLIKSCSHPLKCDIQFFKELIDVDNIDLISCNDYFLVWKSFCNIEKTLRNNTILSEKSKIKILQRKDLSTKIYDEFIRSALQIMEKLDLSMVIDDCDNQVILLNNACTYRPKVGSDFCIFLNLVELFSVVVMDNEKHLLENWIPVLMTRIIALSSSCYVKSGFYKLLAIIFQKAGCEFLSEGRMDMGEVESFLIDTLLDIHNLKDDDLLSCLHIIDIIPIGSLKPIEDHIVPFLQIIFTRGIDNLILSEAGLKMLQKCHIGLHPRNFFKLFKEVIPLLNPLLRSKKSLGDTESLTKYEERLLHSTIAQRKNKIYQKYRQEYNISNNNELIEFQKKLLKFLSEIDIDLCEPIYSREKYCASGSTNMLRFEVPFVDVRVRVFLDKLLPRVVELTWHNDTKTRITACEVLHSMTIIFLGNSQNSEKLRESTGNVFKVLLSSVFKLGSDSNIIIKSIFQQLSYQVTRYYSSKYQYKSDITDHLLTILFETVSNERDNSLRQFSATLIREFVRSSLKNDVDDSAHITAVIKRICLLSIQPHVYRRLGAAITFNNIYREIRGKKNLVNKYWIEILVHFVKSLRLNSEKDCGNKEISLALKHIERVILEQHTIFIESNEHRRVPSCLSGGTLKQCVRWIFFSCVSENVYCRLQCMDLVVNLMSKLTEHDSLEKYFMKAEKEKIEIMNLYFESFTLRTAMFSVCENDDEIFKWLTSLLAGLHCFYWLLKEKAIGIEILLSDNRLLGSLQFFCEKITVEEKKVFKLSVSHTYFIADVPMKILIHDIFYQYLSVLSSCISSVQILLGDNLWQETFWNMFTTYLFFVSTSIQTKTLTNTSTLLKNVLCQLMKLSNEKRSSVISKLRQQESYEIIDSFIIQIDSCQLMSPIVKQHINALIILQKSDALNEVYPDSKERNRRIFEQIYRSKRENKVTENSDIALNIQLKFLLSFSLQNLEITYVLQFLASPHRLILAHESDTTITERCHFFCLFKEPIVEYMYLHQSDIISNCLALSTISKEKLLIVINCLKFASEFSNVLMFNDLINAIFRNWYVLVSWSSASGGSEYLFNLIDAITNRDKELKNLDYNLKSSVFLWLVSRLSNEDDSFVRKRDILKLLPSFIIGIDDSNTMILRNQLTNIQSKFVVMRPTEKQNEENINLFNTLLTLFCHSENKTIFEIIVSVGSLGRSDIHDFNVQKTLETVMHKISSENQLNFLKMSLSFFKNNSSAISSLNCVRKFLIPLLYLSHIDALKSFFALEMENILKMMKSTCDYLDHVSEEKVILFKTAAVLLIEVYSEFENKEMEQTICLEKLIGSTTLKSYISKSLLEIVKNPVHLKNESNYDVSRKLKCYSYNALIKIVKKVPKDEKFYRNVFSEAPGKYIWRCIIDCRHDIVLNMTVEELPARMKALVKQRKSLKLKALNKSCHSIPTQYLSTSSLVSDIKYNMNDWNISSDECIVQQEHNTYEIELESDTFNNHECMSTICELIVFLVESKVTVLPDAKINANPDLPLWMECIKESMRNAIDMKLKNIIMFILKIIVNCRYIFYPYAKSWLNLIIKSVVVLNDVNYLIADVIVTALSWHDVAIPTEKEMNNKLVYLLLDRISRDNTAVRNYQLDLISFFIKFWHEQIDVPYSNIVVNKKVNSTEFETNLKLSKYFLLHEILPFPIENMLTFSDSLLNQSDKIISRSTEILIFEVLALILRTASNKNFEPENCNIIVRKLVQKLNILKEHQVKARIDLFLSCLDHVLTYFPNILRHFAVYLLHNFSKYQGKVKSSCLKIIAKDIEQFPLDTFTQLMSMQFSSCLRENNHEILINALNVLKLYVNVVKVNEMEILLPDVVRLSSHPSTECRSLVYDIVDALYSRFVNSETSRNIVHQCKVVMLNGLLDRDQNLQEKIFISWKSRCQLVDPIMQRFLCIVKEMYSPENESRFVNYAVEYLLDACSSTPDFKSNIFDNPLQHCDFKEQNFSRLAEHSYALMFMNSLSIQLLEISMKSPNLGTLSVRLPGSQKNLYFQPTLNSQSVADTVLSLNENQTLFGTNASVENHDKSIDPELRKLQNRLFSDQTIAIKHFASKNIKKREVRQQLIETRPERMKKAIKLSRNYKNGLCPDIEIPRSAVIVPLKALAKRDSIVAKQVFTIIFDGMLREMSDKETFLQSVSNCFNDILKATLHNDSILIETLLETSFFYSDALKLDAESIVVSCHATSLPSLGCLIIENALSSSNVINTAHVAKKIKVDISKVDTLWIQLAQLYKTLDKNNIVNGILKEKLIGSDNERLKQGLEFEQVKDWERAYDIYFEQINEMSWKNTKSYEKHFIFEAYFKCSANLSKWTELKETIEKSFNNFGDLWKENWDVEHTLPWFFIAESYECSQENATSEYLNTLKMWMKDDKKNAILNNLIPESLAILLHLNGETNKAKCGINNSIESLIEKWIYSTPNLEKFSKLLLLCEIDNMLLPYEMSDTYLSVDAVENVLKMWNSSSLKSINLPWLDRQNVYRQLFALKYMEQLDKNDLRGSQCISKLKLFNIKKDLQMVETALQHENIVLASKFILNADEKKEAENSLNITNLESQFSLILSKLFLLKAIKSKNVEKYKACLEWLEKCGSIKSEYSYHMHLAHTLIAFLNEPQVFTSIEWKNCIVNSIRNLLTRNETDCDNVVHVLRDSIISIYEKAVHSVEDNDSLKISSAYLSLAKYCKGMNQDFREIGNNDNNLIYSKQYIRSILRAIKHDSREAQLLFPTLLQLNGITCHELKSIFITESNAVEEWKFLMWVHQLVALINSRVLSVVEDLIIRIVEKYPSALQFSFLSSDLENAYYKNNAAKHLGERLRKTMNRTNEISDLIKALACVRVPENFFKHYLKRFLNLLKESTSDLQKHINIVKHEVFNDHCFKGILFQENKWWKRLKDLINEINQNSTINHIELKIDQFLKELTVDRNKNHGSSSSNKWLKNYSKWFDSFCDMEIGNIEIPGQYTGFSCPNPKYHVKIFDFHHAIDIQESVKMPIKMKFIGDDGKHYPYLIKFGEDLRQDQRIQQIFVVMNQCCLSNVDEDQEKFLILTYDVFPLTSYFGMIQWVENTTPLRNFMDYHLPDTMKKESKIFKESLMQEYVQELMKFCPSNNELASYEAATKNCSETRTKAVFYNLRNRISHDILKKSLLALCYSPSMYWNLRDQFMTTYSTLCIYGWILGIGDRHLSNTLVCLKTGNCIGIDFGHAFGTGIECLPVPELIPYRMTPHIVSVMTPFNLTGLIKETMISVLQAILKKECVLLATMQIFILDPSFNWLRAAKKLMLKQCHNDIYSVQWYPTKKIEIVKRKLSGENPVKILVEQVKENEIISSSYAEACVKLLRGQNNIRSLMSGKLTVAEQVECLLELATDECILGTSWRGLESYI